MENFSENIRDQISDIEQFHYRQQEQEKEENKLIDDVRKRQKG